MAPAAAGAVVLLSLLVGCGGSDGKSTSATAPPNVPIGKVEAEANTEAAKAYVDCLRANGFAVPTGRAGSDRPTGRPSGRPTWSGGERPSGLPSGRPEPRSTDPVVRKAQEACVGLRPQRGQAGGTAGPERGPNESAMRAFVGCLKDHRVELPFGGMSALDRSDSKVADALKVCEPLLPSAGAAPSPGSAG